MNSIIRTFQFNVFFANAFLISTTIYVFMVKED